MISFPFTREPITSINPNFAIKYLCEQFMLSNETLLTKELMEMEEKIKNKKEKIKKLREKREEEQKLRKLKEEEDARRLEELKRMNPLPINFLYNEYKWQCVSYNNNNYYYNNIKFHSR